ncbi:MAG TPA: lyase family protein [Gemmatimonadota bacterium]|nr:lyase family protein [Gemmatimonadota bacterium]
MSPAPDAPATLWSAPATPDPAMLEFTAGEDRERDRHLLVWDVIGSLGHAEGLAAAGLLEPADDAAIRAALIEILAAVERGTLTLGPGHEDVHTAVEAWLTERAPDAGPRIHAGRSRNDQVACDVRLWLKDRLLDVHAGAAELVDALLDWAERHADALWPGYTHQRRAMVSSAGLWAGAIAEGFLDTLEGLPALWARVDRSPLGSAAGYGAPLPLDRGAAARALGFAAVEHNVAAVQNGRGKLEAAALWWLVELGHDLGRLASDVALWSADEYGLILLPPDLATGSSIMPQKRNPDVFELIRARAAALDGDLATALALRARLTSGYHRDFQLLKEPLMRGVERARGAIGMAARAVPRLAVDRARARAALAGDALATDEVMRRVEAGAPFRAAYREVAAALSAGVTLPAPTDEEIRSRRSTPGGVGDLDLDHPRARLAACRAWAGERERAFRGALARLTDPRRAR